MSICVVDGCEKPVRARGWCINHYMRWRATGDPIPRQRPTYGQRKPGLARNGYLRVWAPEHPLADKDGVVYEHRRVAWDAGILDDPELHVHHLNGDRTDNRLENLVITTNSDHARSHVHERGYVVNQYGTWPVRASG